MSLTPRPLYPRGKRPRYSLDSRLGGPHSRSGSCEVEKISWPWQESNAARPARRSSQYRLSYSGSVLIGKPVLSSNYFMKRLCEDEYRCHAVTREHQARTVLSPHSIWTSPTRHTTHTADQRELRSPPPPTSIYIVTWRQEGGGRTDTFSIWLLKSSQIPNGDIWGKNTEKGTSHTKIAAWNSNFEAKQICRLYYARIRDVIILLLETISAYQIRRPNFIISSRQFSFPRNFFQ